MQLAAFIVFFPFLIAKICSAGLIINGSEPDRSRLVEASIDILESCYTDRIVTVGFAGVSVGSIVKMISLSSTTVPVTLIDETSRIVSHDPIDGASRHKLQVFVVTVNNPSDLVDTLVQVKNSKWWNHMASYVLIDWHEVKNGCSNAYEILWEAWRMNLLNAKFLCLHRTRGRLIYTFNPYTSKAPNPWHQENTYKGMNDHVWTLFMQDYRGDESRCDALDFDKTLDLGGYEIRASVSGMEEWENANPATKPTIYNREQAAYAQILMSSVNATWKLFLRTASDGPLRDDEGNPRASASEVTSGRSDICFNIVDQGTWIKYDTTYPRCGSSVAVITRYRGYKSQMDKLISVLDTSSRWFVLVVLSMTLLFFKFYLRKSLIPAILDLVLLICNAAISRMPTQLAPKLYLGGLFLLLVTIHGIYQGQLRSLLTKQVRLPDVDSIDDLSRSDHKIYGLYYCHFLFNQSAFHGRYVALNKLTCTDHVLRESKTACAGERTRLITDAVKFKLHLSKSVGSVCRTYIIRPDWPLGDRVNAIYRRAREGDIIKPRYARELSSLTKKLESYANEEQDQTAKPLTLGQLGFAFVILAIGLGCATISFIIEVSVHGRPIANPRSRIRRLIRLVT